MKHLPNFFPIIKSAVLCGAMCASLATNAVTIPNKPLVTQTSAKPMVMLVAGKDHKLFYEAYNDTADIDGDGSIDIRFKPTITYYGLFDSTTCYSDNGDDKGNSGLFTPSAAAGALNVCSSGWSGNWLNYITTSRIDSLRKVLYGGFREVDSATQTILRRAYIPQDAHSWAKEYTSTAVDGYKISDYTKLSAPSSGKRHFFGNLTANAGKNCKVLNDCSNLPPLLSVVTNSSKRVWEWASKERPVLDDTHGGSKKDYTVRVLVCTATFNEGCKQYGAVYKPTGLLHDYGENNSMLFGLLTGSYDKNLSGGVVRKVVSSFTDEVNSTTGIFTSNAKIVKTFDNLRIRDFNNDQTDNAYKGGWATTAAMSEGNFPDWGNPVGEMLYESVRYFAGKKTPTSAFTSLGTKDLEVGLSTVTWDDPYSSTSAAKAPWCAKANFLIISDINPSYDSDSLPGSYFSNFSGDLSGLNVENEANTISAVETGITGQRFIGQSGTVSDSAPTAKTVASLGNIRGLAPEEPTKQGSYYSAAVAYFAKRSDLRSDLQGIQNIDTFSVALASPLPRMEVKVPNGRVVTLVPFAKSVGGSGISNTKGDFQPTNQIVDFYVETIANSGVADADASINSGRFYAKFRINYEDVEQGADHDMDAIVEYEIKANADSTVQVTLTPTYEAGGIQHSIGYIISGTTKDGVYLVVQDENVDRPYFLNVPPGRSPGYCDVATNQPADCKKLPYVGGASPLNRSVITFTSSATPSATLLKDPLWYAAKWGGFSDKNNNNKPDLTSEWDADGNGVPDTYFLVQNPLKLKEALKRAFDGIFKTNSSASNVIANSSSVTTNSRVFQARFDANYWSGDLVAYPVTSSGVSTSTEWEASTNMPLPASRKIFVRTTSGTTTEFLRVNLDTANKALLDSDPSATDNSQDVVDYLRGVRTKELQNSGNFRDRSTHVLGDIAHSSPFYEKDNDTIYVGANDGMLHAFKASNGSVAGSAGRELFGFIPSEVISRLKNLTSTGYSHEFFVDGDVVVSPKTVETGNKNLLFAALGRGGKGLFGLDVSNPATFGNTNFLWEYTPAGSTVAASDADLGLMLGRPVYVKMNGGKGAVIVGNGYNSTSGKAVLYIFLLDTSGQVTEVKKIDTLADSDNGLATPGFTDVDGNGTVDFIYAGDLKGNVWKFDVSGTTSSSWVVSLTGVPLFVAKDASDIRQPITAPMTVSINTVAGDTHEGKRFVFFGSGSYFQTGDPANTSTQTWYGLIDENSAITARTQLTVRSVATSGTFTGKPVRSFSAAVVGDMIGKKGWYLDFTSPAGERMVTRSVVYKLAIPTLISSSIIPAASDPCIPGGTGYVNALSPFSGGSVTTGILDVNKNRNYTDDKINGLTIGSVDIGVGLPSEPVLIGNILALSGTESDPTKRVGNVEVNLGAPPLKGRISWREIIKD